MARAPLFDIVADRNGRPLPGASVLLLQPGTATPITDAVYDAAVGGAVLPQPLSPDAYGRLNVWVERGQTVDFKASEPDATTYTVAGYPIHYAPEDVATLAGIQTMTGKTLSSPTIDAPTVSGGSWDGATLTGSPTLATPSLTNPTLVGKLALPTNGASRVFEGLQSALGGAGWGAAGVAFSDPTHLALVDGTASVALAEARPFWVIERHVKPQTADAELTNPLNTFRVTTRVYDQGSPDSGYEATPETASITGIAISSSQQRVNGFGTAIEGVVGYAISQTGSHASPYSLYGINYLNSKNANGFGLEMDSHNGTGQAAWEHRKRPPGYRPNGTSYEGNTYGANLLAVADGGGSDYCTAALLIQGGAGTSRWQQGIVANELAIKSGGEFIDASMLPADVSPLMIQAGGIITAAKAESNSGSVASATSTTLTVAGTPWTASAFIGQWVRITGGTGIGQARLITANTNNTLTVGQWETTPVAADSFIISPNRINVLGTASDNSARFYSDQYWDWRNDAASSLYMRLRTTNAGRLGIGGVDPSGPLHAYGNTAAEPTMVAEAGASVAARLDLLKTGGQRWSLVNGVTSATDGQVAIYDATNNRKLFSADTNGNTFAGAGAVLATNATNGFFYIPITSGTPTGTPGVTTNVAPMVYDYGANKLWIYLTTWRSVTFA